MPGRELVLLIPIFGIIAATVLGYPLIRGIVRYLERKTNPGEDVSALRAEVEELRARLEGFEENVDERLDFAERLLAQQRERPAIRPGQTKER